MPDLLVFNPNTNERLTEELVASAALYLPQVEWRGLTAQSGPRYIASAAGLAKARDSALAALKPASGQEVDGVMLACFGDPGLGELRARLNVPVFGMAECAFAAAVRAGARFGVVTGGAEWPALIEDLARVSGYGAQLAEVRAIASFGEAARAAPEATLEALQAEVLAIVARHGPIPIVLGGTGLAPWHAALAATSPVPILCSWRETLNAVAEWLEL